MSIASNRITKKFVASRPGGMIGVYDTFELALEAISVYYNDAQGYTNPESDTAHVSEIFEVAQIPYTGV